MMETKNKKNKIETAENLIKELTPQQVYDIMVSIMNKYEYDEDVLEENIKWLDVLVQKLMDGEGWQG